MKNFIFHPMKLPINKMILPTNSFSKLLLTNTTPNLSSISRHQTGFGWIYKKHYQGHISSDIIYNILTYAKYDYDREEPNKKLSFY